MGIDIGSTSTKAIIIDSTYKPIAGLYTRTAGRPIIAVQGIFEAIDHIASSHNHTFRFKAVSTTGSGRKFIGKVVGADIILDEISAHARAAVELDPEIDTIIEIGGQDAKFTTLRNGVVTFSKMNTVCAAGTGSFIEEHKPV
jgi:activator of 2-hydroxyglutaryl-CoA dehydratase